MSRVLYLKIEQCVQVPSTTVKIGDIASMECIDSSIVYRLKTENLLKIDSDPKQRKVVSVMFVIQKIHEIYPELEVQNLGEADFMIGLKPKEQARWLVAIKVTAVSIVSFFGAVFAMLTFNEDVNTNDSFQKVYAWVMGMPPQGDTILELTYSLGLAVGIIVFFNHFGKKHLTQEPSPVEVEMSGYDQQVYTTVIQQAGRVGQEKDVD